VEYTLVLTVVALVLVAFRNLIGTVGGAGFLSGIPSAAPGGGASYSLAGDGTVRAWGTNDVGELGLGGPPDESIHSNPVRVSVLANVIAIAAYSAVPGSGFLGHAIAVESDGSVWTWGGNGDGEMGIPGVADSSAHSTPTKVAGVSDVSAVAAGAGDDFAFTNTGTLVSWGSNNYGQLGNACPSPCTTPTPVTAITGVTQLVAGMYVTQALKTDGTVWDWGFNLDGNLGIGALVPGSTAVPQQVRTTDGGLTGVTAIALEYALRDDGSVWSWGPEGGGGRCYCATQAMR